MAKLIIRTGEHDLNIQELHEGVITIGRDADNTVVLADSTVSSHHGEIVVKSGDCLLRDLGSSNGINVNGQRVGEVVLSQGDTIDFGGVEATFIDEHENSGTNASYSVCPTADFESGGEISQSTFSRIRGAILAEFKRGARLAFLKSKIEKLNKIDIPKSLLVLGRTSYQNRIFIQELESEYAKVEKLENTISIKQVSTAENIEESELQKLKQVGQSVKMHVHIEALRLKIKWHFIRIGQIVEETGEDMKVKVEQDNLLTIRKYTEELKTIYRTLSLDGSAKSELMAQVAYAVKESARWLLNARDHVRNTILSPKSRTVVLASFIFLFSVVTVIIVRRVSKPEMGMAYQSHDVSFLLPKSWAIRDVPGLSYKNGFGPSSGGFLPNVVVVESNDDQPIQSYLDANLRSLSKTSSIVDKSSFSTQSGLEGFRIVADSEKGGKKLRGISYGFLIPRHRKLLVTWGFSFEQALTYSSATDFAMKGLSSTGEGIASPELASPSPSFEESHYGFSKDDLERAIRNGRRDGLIK